MGNKNCGDFALKKCIESLMVSVFAEQKCIEPYLFSGVFALRIMLVFF